MTPYALTSMENREHLCFRVYIADTPAGADAVHIQLPADYPRSVIYEESKQAIHPLATLHHEFEHTRFGTSSVHEAGSIEDEVIAVRAMENPVRALYQMEPRYTYVTTDGDKKTATIVSYKKDTAYTKKVGKWVYCNSDISKLVEPRDKK